MLSGDATVNTLFQRQIAFVNVVPTHLVRNLDEGRDAPSDILEIRSGFEEVQSNAQYGVLGEVQLKQFDLILSKYYN